MQTRDDVILAFGRDPGLAHAALFRHRHTAATPLFHETIIRKWHAPLRRYQAMAFRGGAKSTISEEGTIVEACLQRFRNALIIGSNEARAVDRLRSIKNEFETNEFIFDIFGDLRGEIWQETKIVLTNGLVMQAVGRGQSLRGVKHLDRRPDLLLGDDIEDEESVASPDARDKMAKWFYAVVVPALDPEHRIRIASTPLDVEALSMVWRNNPDWETDVYPIEHIDPVTHERAATWPERFPLSWIDAQRDEFYKSGRSTEYQREFMCEPTDPALKTFTAQMIKTEPVVRTWHPVYAMYDPARTTRITSDRTGKAVWSWVGPRLIVWEGAASLWKPDEIINDIFDTDARYNPVAIGVEEDGLNEFLLQPLRTEQARRGHAIPIRPLKAPKGKIDFIKSLQPYFKAGEVIFAQQMPELIQQLLAFPTGKIDFVNALAYSLKLQPGMPMYDFNMQHIVEDTPRARDNPLYLAINGAPHATAAILLQLNNQTLYVHADWLREGDPGTALPDILVQAQLEAAGKRMKVIAPPQHFSDFSPLGLRAACAKIPVDVHKGGALHVGREELRALMRKQVTGHSALQVSTQATWTLRALSGGYARAMERGHVSEFAADNAYRVLAEGLEAFAAMARVDRGDDTTRNYAYTESGQRHLTARAS